MISRTLSDLRSVARIAVLLLLIASLSLVLLTGCKLIENETESAESGTSSEPIADSSEPASESGTTPEEESSSEPEETSSKPPRLPMDEF